MDKNQIRKDKQDESNRLRLKKEINRSMKYPDCLKLLSVYIDDKIKNLKTSEEILKIFTSLEGPTYLIENHNFCLPFSVRWLVMIQNIIYDNGSWTIERSYEFDNEVLLLIPGSEFIKLIKSEDNILNINSLNEFTNQIKLSNVKATLILMGLDEELLKLKATTKDGKATQKAVNETLIDLQIDHRICVHKMSSSDDVGKFMICFSKAVAQKHYKETVKETDELFEFTLNPGTNTTINVPCAAGELGGVDMLWRSQLMQFRGVTQEIADAIRRKFPTPRSLYDSLMNISIESGENDAIAIISEIEVRRGTDVLATTRKVGKEISSRIYTFLTSVDASCSIY